MIIYKGTQSLFQHTNTKEMQKLLEDDNASRKRSMTQSLSWKLGKMMEQSGGNSILDSINCVMTLFEVIFYIPNNPRPRLKTLAIPLVALVASVISLYFSSFL